MRRPTTDEATTISPPDTNEIQPFAATIAGTLLAAREATMLPLRPKLREMDLTEAQWRALRAVVEHEGLTGRSIARYALLHPPSVSRILKELVDRGLVQQRVDETNGRRHVIVPTLLAKDIVDNAAATNRAILELYRKEFGGERLTELLCELRAFTAVALKVAEQFS